MKSKKIMGLLLAGAIFVGATAYGSNAWFTDTETTDANINITMGNLDIALDELPEDEQWWVKEGTETDEENGDYDFENGTDYFSNVRPGDVFTRTIPVVNEGTLRAKVNVALAENISTTVVGQDTEGNDLLFDQVFELVTTGTGVTSIERGETIDVNLELKVKEDLGNIANASNGSEAVVSFNLNDALNTEFVVVTANQANK